MYRPLRHFTAPQQKTILVTYQFVDKEQFYQKLRELGCDIDSIRKDHDWAYQNHYCKYVKWIIEIRDFSMINIKLIDEVGTVYGSSRLWNYELINVIKGQA